MKKIGYKIFCIVFFVACLQPLVQMPMQTSEVSENRSLSKFPTWTTEEGNWNQAWFNELTTYVAEHFYGRGKLIEWNNQIRFHVFQSPGDDQVILGKDGWLFFDATLNDYAGVTLSSEEIAQIADKLTKVQEYVRQQGKEPIFMIVPNKSSVYSEYMPARFGEKSKVTNLSLLQEAMQERNVSYLDVQKCLLDGKQMDELYLHQDTHWNNTGARLVLNELYKKLNIDYAYDLAGFQMENTHESDLSKILFPSAENLEAQRIYDPVGSFEYVGRMRSLDDLTIQTINNNGNGKNILVFRDSFGRAMVSYMAEVFDSCTFQRATPYTLSSVDATECDYVVFEIVERNVADLGQIEIP